MSNCPNCNHVLPDTPEFYPNLSDADCDDGKGSVEIECTCPHCQHPFIVRADIEWSCTPEAK